MKAFVAACILFCVLVVALFGSSAWLSARAQVLYKTAASFPTLPVAERSEALHAFSEQWEAERLSFVIFIHKEELLPLESALTRALAAAEIKSDSDYQIAVAEVAANLAQLKTQVELHIEGIF